MDIQSTIDIQSLIIIKIIAIIKAITKITRTTATTTTTTTTIIIIIIQIHMPVIKKRKSTKILNGNPHPAKVGNCEGTSNLPQTPNTKYQARIIVIIYFLK